MGEDADFTDQKIHYFGKFATNNLRAQLRAQIHSLARFPSQKRGSLFEHEHVLKCACAGGIISVSGVSLKFADISGYMRPNTLVMYAEFT